MSVNIYLHKKKKKIDERRLKDGRKKSLGEVRIMMFYRCYENVNLTHSTKVIAITLLKYSFNVPPKKQNNRVYPMSHKFRRDVLGTSLGRQFFKKIQNILLLYYH